MKTKLSLLILPSLLSAIVPAFAGPVDPLAKPKTDNEMTAEVKNIMKSVDEVKRLPVTGLSMIKADDKVFLITDNGHFVVAGNFKLVDMWQGKVIGSVADTQGIEKVDLRKIGFNPDELSTFSIGNGKKEVTIFVDPQCHYCHDLMGQLEPLGKEYKFNLVLIPVLGKESAEITKKLICNLDKVQSLKALLDQNYEKLPTIPPVDLAKVAKGTQKEPCDLKVLQKAVVATKLLDIQGVPTIFLPSKNVHRGGAKSFKTLLEKDLEDEINGR